MLLRGNGTAQPLGLGVPEDRSDTTTHGITVKFQQAEREDSARPIPPFPWPYVYLLITSEESNNDCTISGSKLWK